MFQNEFLRHQIVILCFATAFLLLVLQWQAADSMRENKEVKKTEKKEVRAKRGSPKLPTLDSLKAEKASLTYRVHLVVDLSDRKVNIYQNNQLKASYPVAVGQEDWQTPTGDFQILQMQKNPIWRHPITNQIVPPGPNNPLGVRWIGFWWDERHSIGFHGTNQKEGVGKAISHGCLRMKNQDIEALYKLVTIGTSVKIKR